MNSVLLLLADGFEEIEATAPIDILRRAGVRVTAAGIAGLEVTGGHNIKMLADTILEKAAHENFDMVILPGGGRGTENLAASRQVLELLKKYKKESKYIAAICAAPTVLAKAGVIDGHKVTSYPGTEDAFAKENYVTDKKVVVSDKIITSRGPGTAMDFALELVSALCGAAKKEEIKKQLIIM